MAYYYNLPQKATLTKAQILKIQQQNQLKFSSQQSTFLSIILLNMKNTKVNDQSTLCLSFIQQQLKIQIIDLSQNFSFITDSTIQNLCNCQGLINIKNLNLADNSITDVGIQMLTSHSNFKNLKSLIVYGNSDVTDIAFMSLGKSEWVKGVEKLDFHATSVKDKGLCQFIKSENSQCLIDLNVSMNWNRITNLTLQALSKSTFCKSIKHLNLQDCSITDHGIQLICLSQNLWNLSYLNIGNSIQKSKNKISDKTLQAISYSKMFNLKTLYLKSTDVTGRGIKYLTSSPVIEKLETLKVSHCKGVGDQVLEYIGMVVEYAGITKLHVNSTGVSKEKGAEFEEKYQKIMIIY